MKQETEHAINYLERARPFLDEKHQYELDTLLMSLRSDLSETFRMKETVYAGAMGDTP